MDPVTHPLVRLAGVRRELAEMFVSETRPTPVERIRLARELASLMLQAEVIATVEDEDRTLEALEREDALWEGHAAACDLLVALIAGPNAVAQMDAIERRCAAGGF